MSTNHHYSSAGRSHFFPDSAILHCHMPLWLGVLQADESETCTLSVSQRRDKLGALDPLRTRQIFMYPPPFENVGYLLVQIVNLLRGIDFVLHRKALTANTTALLSPNLDPVSTQPLLTESSVALIFTLNICNTGSGFIPEAHLLQSNHSRFRQKAGNNTQQLIIKALNRRNLIIDRSLYRTNSGGHGNSVFNPRFLNFNLGPSGPSGFDKRWIVDMALDLEGMGLIYHLLYLLKTHSHVLISHGFDIHFTSLSRFIFSIRESGIYRLNIGLNEYPQSYPQLRSFMVLSVRVSSHRVGVSSCCEDDKACFLLMARQFSTFDLCPIYNPITFKLMMLCLMSTVIPFGVALVVLPFRSKTMITSMGLSLETVNHQYLRPDCIILYSNRDQAGTTSTPSLLVNVLMGLCYPPPAANDRGLEKDVNVWVVLSSPIRSIVILVDALYCLIFCCVEWDFGLGSNLGGLESQTVFTVLVQYSKLRCSSVVTDSHIRILTSLSDGHSRLRESLVIVLLFWRLVNPGRPQIVRRESQRFNSLLGKIYTAIMRALNGLLGAALLWSDFRKCKIYVIKHLDLIEGCCLLGDFHRFSMYPEDLSIYLSFVIIPWLFF